MSDASTLTHALPLRLLERGVEERGREVATFEASLAASSSFFAGHFPGRPIFPGIAQVAALVLPAVHLLWPELTQPRRLQRLKFRAPISPGETLTLTLERSEASSVRFRLVRAARLCSEGFLDFQREPR